MSETYNEFIERNANFASDLFKQLSEQKIVLEKESTEKSLYNPGSENVTPNPNIHLVNSDKLKQSFADAKSQNPEAADENLKSGVFLDYLREILPDEEYNKISNMDDTLFKMGELEVKRGSFYSYMFDNAVSNVDYKDKYIGDAQIISVNNIGNDIPKSMRNLPKELKSKMENASAEADFPTVFRERGFYHEAFHTMGTKDERKCDAFAMLKLIQNHPKHADLICEIYSQSRIDVNYTLQHAQKDFDGAVSQGSMTYIMPHTYEKLKKVAANPELLKGKTDLDLAKMALQVTNGDEFSRAQMTEFRNTVSQKNINKDELFNTDVMKAVVKQAGYAKEGEYDIDGYLQANPKMQAFVDIQCPKKQISEKIKHLRQSMKPDNMGVQPAPKFKNLQQTDLKIDCSKQSDKTR